VPEAFADPQVAALNVVRTLPHPTAGELRVVAPPFSLSESEVGPRSAPPLLGQHTAEVLRDVLGRSDDEIAALRADGAI
jgi:crotonobetainyl-CoA:carnitine CoA-transferase CaiB-like acyl-CoA transferase